MQTLGADTVINTAVPDEALAQAYLDAKGMATTSCSITSGGKPTEILLRSLVPKSFAFPKPTRLIQVGESAGAALTLAAESLRTSGVEIYGAAKGLSSQTMHEVYSQVVAWAQTGELTFDMVKVLGVSRPPGNAPIYGAAGSSWCRDRQARSGAKSVKTARHARQATAANATCRLAPVMASSSRTPSRLNCCSPSARPRRRGGHRCPHR